MKSTFLKCSTSCTRQEQSIGAQQNKSRRFDNTLLFPFYAGLPSKQATASPDAHNCYSVAPPSETSPSPGAGVFSASALSRFDKVLISRNQMPGAKIVRRETAMRQRLETRLAWGGARKMWPRQEKDTHPGSSMVKDISSCMIWFLRRGSQGSGSNKRKTNEAHPQPPAISAILQTHVSPVQGEGQARGNASTHR